MTRRRSSVGPGVWRVLALAAWLLGAATIARAQADDDLGDLGDLGDDDDAAQTASDAASSDDSGSDDDSAAADAQAPDPSAAPVAGPSGPSVAIAPYVGVGMTTRSFERPVHMSAQSMTSTVVPALETGLVVTAWPQDAYALRFALRYQTSIGLTVTERPPFALPNEVHVRSERIELSVAPDWRLGEGVRLAIPIGGIARTLWPNVHTLMTPGYSLIGPFARVELELALAGSVHLRLAPEAQWIVSIDESLRADGVDQQGLALGGEVTLGFDLGGAWSVALNYRESHAFASSTASVSFTDVERYLTARLLGVF